MDAETRLKLAIGDLVFKLQLSSAKIDELEAKIKELEAARPPSDD